MATKPETGTVATLAIIAAIGGVVLIFVGQPGWGLLAEIFAVVLGAVGLISAASPRVSGGMISVAAIVISIFGIGLSVLGLVGSLVF